MVPKVSVIVATRNRPDFLLRCLIAIKLQTFQEFECIVVGDNCNYSEYVVRLFQEKDKRFKYIKFVGDRPVNQGATAKNIGLELASGRYIAYCDDDNIWLLNHLSVLLKCFETTFLSHGVTIRYANSMFYHYDHGEDIESLLKEDLYYGSLNLTQANDALVILHENKDNIRWTERAYLNDMHEDTWLMKQLGSCVMSHIPTAIYHQHSCEGRHKDGDYAEKVKHVINGFVHPEYAEKLIKKYL